MEIAVSIISVLGIIAIGVLAWYGDKKREQYKNWGDMSEEDKADFFKSEPFKIKE